MNNIFLSAHPNISGSFINFLDYYEYYKNEYQLYWFNPYNKNFNDLLKKTFRDYKINKVKIFKEKIIKGNIIITDFVSLLEIKKSYRFLKANKLIIFDNLELILFLKKIKNNIHIKRFDFIWNFNLLQLIKSFCSFKELYFLVTPFIMNYLSYDFIIPYLKKINIKVLKMIKQQPIKKCFSREYVNDEIDYLPNLYGINPFQYECYYYKHRKELSYIEMFGRLIFEFILTNRRVKFAENISNFSDGLLDYVKYYSLNKTKLLKMIDIENDKILKGIM